MQQVVQTDATCNIQQCWELLANNVASVCTGLNTTTKRTELNDDLMGKPFTLLQEIFETGSILQKLWNESPFNFSFLSKTQLI